MSGIDGDDRGDVTRRSILAGSIGATLALAATPAAAQRCPAPPHAKGPPVWLDMDQKELDDAYTQLVYAPFTEQTNYARMDQANATALAKIGPPESIAYGTPERERVLLYRARNASAPTLIFLHGGAWQAGRAGQPAMAECITKAGANFVAVDFSNVGETGGDIGKMVDQCRRAVAFLYRNGHEKGIDPARLYLSGHSSGAHLAGCVLITDWQREGLPLDIVKGAILASGMYDLKPVRLSVRSSYVKFTDEMEQALSAQRHLDRLHTPLVLLHGALETPEFQRQTRDFAAAVRAAGKPVQSLVGNGHTHFDMQDSLANPYGLMGRAALDMMKLTA